MTSALASTLASPYDTTTLSDGLRGGLRMPDRVLLPLLGRSSGGGEGAASASGPPPPPDSMSPPSGGGEGGGELKPATVDVSMDVALSVSWLARRGGRVGRVARPCSKF